MRNAYLELLEKQDAEWAERVDKAIQLFCKAWLDWVNAGTPHGKVMLSTHMGMCDNLPYWMMENGYNYDDRFAALDVMCAEFHSRYGTSSFPFSDPYTPGGGAIDTRGWQFQTERSEGTMHLNERRLAWAREKAAMLEKENV
jgi:hypothetical protein